jgi:galactoside 2-L-fucosyltransferase 1/2
MHKQGVYVLIACFITTYAAVVCFMQCCLHGSRRRGNDYVMTSVQQPLHPQGTAPQAPHMPQRKRIFHEYGGRLGNILFQFAAITSLAKQFNSTACFDNDALHGLFEQQSDTCICQAPAGAEVLSENRNYAMHVNFTILDDTVLYGYFQSYKYFDPEVLQSLRIQTRFKTHARIILSQVLAMPIARPRAAIHIRNLHKSGETDLIPLPRLIQEPHSYLRFPLPFYFEYAMAYLRERHPAITFVVLSDNPAWCQKQAFLQHEDVSFVAPDNTPIVDLALIAECDHVILSRGTFGWWGAFLGASTRGGLVLYNAAEFDMQDPVNAEHVVLADFYPAHWISIGIGSQLKPPRIYAPNTYTQA